MDELRKLQRRAGRQARRLAETLDRIERLKAQNQPPPTS